MSATQLARPRPLQSRQSLKACALPLSVEPAHLAAQDDITHSGALDDQAVLLGCDLQVQAQFFRDRLARI
jgi:hypothetical protein